MNYLSPSLLAADFAKLGEQVQLIEQAGAHYAHIDVMDGMFVPSISFGLPVIASIRKVSKIPFDVHLMIEEPDRYIKEFADAGADIITVHAEACKHLDRTIQHIHECGLKAGVALNPSTPLEVLRYVLEDLDLVLVMSVNPGFGGQKYIPYSTKKIKELRKMCDEVNPDIMLEVDGGIKTTNVLEVIGAGANMIVAGSAVFKDDVTKNVTEFLKLMNQD
ncbi:ribulose-phosphate 3-epimerase [Eubacterium oxidoreducens]|uniref:Ribulose-phosphate 3-epimerase n=1 Tax=Eubacterium oxidoreducens TaxID=1732 RepID=A0A1G6B683_EUBOX|nr:ribulose-phosphate 3-epimerase [Eubacterium oxidoreducens]SDB16145.1 ribulose-phosphate 3-epimerase [Eubacterium oxidoreducens]